MNFTIYTLGCKVNTYESEVLIEKMKETGYKYIEFDDKQHRKDIYIINTCTVTNESDSKSRQIIRKCKKENPEAIIVAIGCFIQSSFPEIMDEVDINVGNGKKLEIINLINTFKNEHKKLSTVQKVVNNPFENMNVQMMEDHTRAFVKIQDGCDSFCSFCIIPFVRGRVRSKDRDLVVSEIKELVSNNYREVVLTGIHTGQYGKDLGCSFAELLQDITNIEGLERIRISSIEVNELTDEVVELIKKNKKIVDHFHIPLQSGSDVVLKLMNRQYLSKDYLKKVKDIRKIRPDAYFAADLIVGHPGETDIEFNNTVEFIKKCGINKIHVFPYSIRKNTKSGKMKQIDPKIKKQRVHTIINLSEELEEKYYRNFIGKTKEVLIEGHDDIFSYGHTDNFLNIRLRGIYDNNTMIPVMIKDYVKPYAIGEKIN